MFDGSLSFCHSGKPQRGAKEHAGYAGWDGMALGGSVGEKWRGEGEVTGAREQVEARRDQIL